MASKNPGFEDLAWKAARARRLISESDHGARILLRTLSGFEGLAPKKMSGFEDLALTGSRVRGFRPDKGQVSTIWPRKGLGFEDLALLKARV